MYINFAKSQHNQLIMRAAQLKLSQPLKMSAKIWYTYNFRGGACASWKMSSHHNEDGDGVGGGGGGGRGGVLALDEESAEN